MGMSAPTEKIVEFDIWCERCKNKDKSETDDPCFECLENPVNIGSRKPVKFEEKKNENTNSGR